MIKRQNIDNKYLYYSIRRRSLSVVVDAVIIILLLFLFSSFVSVGCVFCIVVSRIHYPITNFFHKSMHRWVIMTSQIQNLYDRLFSIHKHTYSIDRTHSLFSFKDFFTELIIIFIFVLFSLSQPDASKKKYPDSTYTPNI